MGLEAALAWKTCTFGLTKKLLRTDSFKYKKLLTVLRSLEAFLFQMNRDNSRNSIDLIWLANASVCYRIIETKK